MLHACPVLLLALTQTFAPRPAVGLGLGDLIEAEPNALVIDDDRIAFVRRTGQGDELTVRTTDGRGLQWGPGLRLGLAPAGAEILELESALSGDKLVLAWSDDRNDPTPALNGPKSSAFLRTLDLETGALGPEVVLPLYGPPGAVESTVVQLEAEQTPGGLHLHVLLRTEGFGPNSVTWRVLSSHDGGATFPYVLEPWNAPGFLGDRVALHLDQGTLHLLAARTTTDTFDGQVAYWRSADAGMTLAGSQAVVLREHPSLGFAELELAADGPQLVLTWEEQGVAPVSFQPFADLRAVVSLDGGVTFSPDRVLEAVSDYNRIDQPRALSLGATGSVLVAWLKSNADSYDATVKLAQTSDGGASWTTTLAVPFQQSARMGALVGGGQNRSRAALTWKSGSAFLGVEIKSSVVGTLDGGSTWTLPAALPPAGQEVEHAVWSSRYQNVVATTRGPAGWMAAGARAQGLSGELLTSPSAPGFTRLELALAGFDDGAPAGWVLASTLPGSLPLPLGDGRDLGLLPSMLLSNTVQLALAGVLSAPLDGAGAAQLAPLDVTLPPGLSLGLVGLSLDPNSLTFGDLSDVRTVTF